MKKWTRTLVPALLVMLLPLAAGCAGAPQMLQVNGVTMQLNSARDGLWSYTVNEHAVDWSYRRGTATLARDGAQVATVRGSEATFTLDSRTLVAAFDGAGQVTEVTVPVGTEVTAADYDVMRDVLAVHVQASQAAGGNKRAAVAWFIVLLLLGIGLILLSWPIPKWIASHMAPRESVLGNIRMGMRISGAVLFLISLIVLFAGVI